MGRVLKWIDATGRYLVASTFDSVTTGRYIEIHRTCTGTQGTLYVIVRECPILWLVEWWWWWWWMRTHHMYCNYGGVYEECTHTTLSQCLVFENKFNNDNIVLSG
jgi:hypothetical protein